ncbi:MAG: hypothetical protein IJ300_13985 [Clostridia bacterium]|nr:hypothetical protein [Clostridia bacterium]
MNNMVRYVKTVLWLFILSVVYVNIRPEAFNASFELMLIFAGVYSCCAKGLTDAIVISVLCALVMCSYGTAGFALSVLSCTYFSLALLSYKPCKRRFLKIGLAVLFAMAVFEAGRQIISDEGINANNIILFGICNTLIFAFIYFPVSNNLKVKKRGIF